MPFTFTQEASPNNLNNSFDTANIDIVVSPTDSIINAVNFIGGQEDSGSLEVSNNSDVDIFYFISADWRESPGTSIQMATILANRLTVSVVTSPDDEEVFIGKLSQLINQPSGGQLLELADPVEGLTFTLALAEQDATNLVQDVGILTDFVFVATQSPI
ncbi:hypothetical protein [Candidatus Contubernalis alkaliaceticus]|uniref:hypothetical protein n=1 Tax=Candidatus Contubernalis alkaliaceticus TaxID=338645 RepID=UPI001F4BF2E4|nr:hypothetical protein [Candidatus Contubernalis alkalaceticus]UNC91153.1 hypothetical protein HUE98_03055 [Candidatus Contubernalis alkalaceticus]